MARKKRLELQLEPSGSYTVRDAFKFWCNKKKGRISSYRDEKLRLEKYIVSKIGNRQLDSINPPILIKLVEPIEAAGKQSLRDIPAQAGFPETVIWPNEPEYTILSA